MERCTLDEHRLQPECLGFKGAALAWPQAWPILVSFWNQVPELEDIIKNIIKESFAATQNSFAATQNYHII